MNHWVQNKRKKEKQQQQYNGIYDNKIKLLQILITVYGVILRLIRRMHKMYFYYKCSHNRLGLPTTANFLFIYFE